MREDTTPPREFHELAPSQVTERQTLLLSSSFLLCSENLVASATILCDLWMFGRKDFLAPAAFYFEGVLERCGIDEHVFPNDRSNFSF